MRNIVNAFLTQGTINSITPLGSGLINDTYLVHTSEPDRADYVLQRINNSVFADVPLLQHNIEAVTRHLLTRYRRLGLADAGRRVLTFLRTPDGNTFHRDDQGGYWRMSVYIDRTRSLEEVTPQSAMSAGKAFGQFEADLVDLPEQLKETIPDFHNLEFRLRQLREAVAADALGRVKHSPIVRQMLERMERDASSMCLAERLHREGKLRKRICHCDTKVNNILFDEQGEVLCVVDLDTVMPSYIFSDYGDFLRSAVNTTAEDDPDLSHVGFNRPVFEAFTRGYLQAARSFLTPFEVELLPYGVALFPYMQAVRFMWDYISGDHYWKCRYADHNLDRARNQLRLYEVVEGHRDEMTQFINTINNDSRS